MALALITAKQVLVLFLLMLSGFVCAKTGAVKPEARKFFSDLLIYLVVPAMIINSYMTEFRAEVAQNLMLSFGLGTVLLLLGVVITLMVTRRLKGQQDAPIIRFACIFSNAAYMGFPLIQALFGAEGLLYASAFVTMFNILLWTVGYAMVAGKTGGKEILRGIAGTPVLWSVLLGLVLYLGRIPLPELLRQPITQIGNMNTPLAMIITGMMIAGCSPKSILCSPAIIRTTVVRMVIIPAVCMGLFVLLGLRGMVPTVLLLLEACPCAAITSVFAVQFGHNEELAAGSVVFSTLVSILLLPLWAMALSAVMG
ncbi:MAG: AEC family transporter [Clostridia bacterium]|nr:AEC family transporter [Clostridia bacterium]